VAPASRCVVRGVRRGSAIKWPLDALTEPDHIEIGRDVSIRAHARLEAVRVEADAEAGRLHIGDDVQIEGYFSVAAAEVGHDRQQRSYRLERRDPRPRPRAASPTGTERGRRS
jgi:hypothetical protein